jgi:tetratricopeptide (TPR) repeat protein
MEKVLAENPDTWQGYYNAACFEALTGNDDEAIAHLRRAIELDQQALEYSKDDSDFDGLRDRPNFPS